MKWFFRRFFNTHALFYCFAIISLVKRVLPFISTIKVPLSIRMFCTKFGYIWPSGSRKEVKNVKSLHTDRRTTDNTWIFGSGELKADGEQNGYFQKQSSVLQTDGMADRQMDKLFAMYPYFCNEGLWCSELTIQTPCTTCHLSCRFPVVPQCEDASACGIYWLPSSGLEQW